MCALAGPLFQHQSLRRQTSHCSKEPRKITRRESDVSCLMYFDIFFFLVMMLRCQNCIFFYFYLVMFLILYPDKDYCRCLSFMWNETSGCLFVYVCENLAPLLQRKVFTKEISLFVSLCWPSSRTRTPYFGIGAWHDFVGIWARLILISHQIKTIRFTYKKKHL